MTSPDSAQNLPAPVYEERRRRRRRSRSGTNARGIIYLILFWLLLGVYHLAGYLSAADYAKQGYARVEAPMFVITTSLFAGVICRQNWSRYLLIALLLWRVGSTLIFVPTYTESMLQSLEVVFNVLSGPVIDGLIIWGLIAIPSIRRLVSRTYQ